MPNYPLTPPVREHIQAQVRRLAERSAAQVRSLFPLTQAEIQDLVLDRDTCAELQSLMDRGVKTISKHSTLRVAFFGAGHESARRIPELQRSIILKINGDVARGHRTDHGWFVKYSTYYGINGTITYDPNSEQYIVADLSLLPEERRQKLIQWLDRILYQERIKEVAIKVTQDVVNYLCATTTHLHTLFPTLTRVVDPGEVRGKPDPYWEKWVEKLRNPAKNLYNYLPEDWVVATYKPLFPVVEQAIAAGKLIGHDIPEDRTKIKAEIEHWQRLANDVKFPLARKEPKPLPPI